MLTGSECLNALSPLCATCALSYYHTDKKQNRVLKQIVKSMNRDIVEQNLLRKVRPMSIRGLLQAVHNNDS